MTDPCMDQPERDGEEGRRGAARGREEAARLRGMMREALAGAPARAARYAHLFERAAAAADARRAHEGGGDDAISLFGGIIDAMACVREHRWRMLRAMGASGWPSSEEW